MQTWKTSSRSTSSWQRTSSLLFLAVLASGALLRRCFDCAWAHGNASSTGRPLAGRRLRVPRHRQHVALNAEDDEGRPLEITEDWREFRARLVQQESVEDGRAIEDDESDDEDGELQGWAHPTPIIETGSLLLSSPGDQFALSQQYFHKTLIFIVEHTAAFTRGVILNRPTAFNTTDLEYALGSDLPVNILNTSDAWNVWCGGDCQGLKRRHDEVDGVAYICLHTVERFAASSRQLIKGVFMIDLADAKQLVAAGEADKDDFLLLVGYCGWAPGQLQDELDRGDTWTLAAADRQALLGRLSEAQASLTQRLEEASRQRQLPGVEPLTAEVLGDGLEEWRKLYAALGPSFSILAEEDLEDLPGCEGQLVSERHVDNMLQRWIERCLIPPRDKAQNDVLLLASEEVPRALPRGSMLRGSATSWLLGKPTEAPSMERCFGRGLPGQYLHKAVLLLVGDYDPEMKEQEQVLLALLNGPQVGETEADQGKVFFGGPEHVGGHGVFELCGDVPYRFQGIVSFEVDDFHELLHLGALEVVPEDVRLQEVLERPVEERWEAAGGKIDSLKVAAEGKVGDLQQRLWYKQFFGIDFPTNV